MVGYERIVALGISLVTALAGAWYIFGGVAVDIARGGGELLKLIAGLLAAIAASAAMDWGRLAILAVRRLPAFLTVRRGIRTALRARRKNVQWGRRGSVLVCLGCGC